MISFEILNPERVEFYKDEIKKGNFPTAISLSVLDVKQPAMWPDENVRPEHTTHWCLAHYVIDGHHKIKAASELGQEITLLSFIATDKGVSSLDDIRFLIEKFKK